MEGEGSSGKAVEKKYIYCYGVDLELKEDGENGNE